MMSTPWEVTEIPGAGRGLRATRPISVGEVLLSVPLTECWPTACSARSTLLPFQENSDAKGLEIELSDEAVVALWLCEELQRLDSSPFAGHLVTLPRELDTILQWNDEEATELNGSCFYNIAAGLREETEEEWMMLMSHPSWQRWRTEHPEFNRERFNWAKAIVMSRQMDTELESEDTTLKVVAPGPDLLNHDVTGNPNCCFEISGAGNETSGSQAVVVRCMHEVAEGDELQISYGPLPNASLVFSHGFAAERNPFDCVEVVLSFAIPPARMVWLEKIKELAVNSEGTGFAPFEVHGGSDDGEIVTIHRLYRTTPLPLTLLATVRLQTFSVSELDGLAASATDICSPMGTLQVSSDNAAMSRLGGILHGLMKGHPTSAMEDAALLQKNGTVEDPEKPPLPPHHRMAVQVRLSEKEILAAAISALGCAGP